MAVALLNLRFKLRRGNEAAGARGVGVLAGAELQTLWAALRSARSVVPYKRCMFARTQKPSAMVGAPFHALPAKDDSKLSEWCHMAGKTSSVSSWSAIFSLPK